MERIAPMRVGILFTLLTLGFGFGLGGLFGAREDAMKAALKADAEAVLEPRYDGDRAAMKKVTDKAWAYYKRAHLHANGLGTSSLALILLSSLIATAPRTKAAVALALGIGSLGYTLFWLFAGMRAPGLGSTGAAKASLQWLAVPSSGLCCLGLIAVMVLCVRALYAQRTPSV